MNKLPPLLLLIVIVSGFASSASAMWKKWPCQCDKERCPVPCKDDPNSSDFTGPAATESKYLSLSFGEWTKKKKPEWCFKCSCKSYGVGSVGKGAVAASGRENDGLDVGEHVMQFLTDNNHFTFDIPTDAANIGAGAP